MAFEHSSNLFLEEESDVTDIVHRSTPLHKMTAKRRAFTIVSYKGSISVVLDNQTPNNTTLDRNFLMYHATDFARTEYGRSIANSSYLYPRCVVFESRSRTEGFSDSPVPSGKDHNSTHKLKFVSIRTK